MQFLKLLSGYLAIFFLLACSSSADKTQFVENLISNKKVVSDTLIKQSERQTLVGKIFLFAPELDKEACRATGGCDCCSYNILFTTDSTFVLIDYCEADYSYNKGSYFLDNSSLTLKVDRLMVNKNYNWKKETDTTGKVTTEYFYKIENIKPTTTIVKRQDCNGTMIFKGDSDFGTVDNERTFENELKALKEEGIWTKLKLR